MPRLVRRSKFRRMPASSSGRVTHNLRTGQDWWWLDASLGGCSDPPIDDDILRAAWSEVGGEILAEWIAENPGTRPAGWWSFSAPERRRRINGAHPLDNPARPAGFNELRFGKPRCLCCLDDFEATFESETDFLRRLNLLDAEEENHLKKNGETHE